MQMSRDQSMQMYKKLALLLHPDKNQHPLAKEAFQKLSEANKAVSNSACWNLHELSQSTETDTSALAQPRKRVTGQSLVI